LGPAKLLVAPSVTAIAAIASRVFEQTHLNNVRQFFR
jgi:hypothetical protein